MMQLKSLSAGLALMGASVATTVGAPSVLAQEASWGYEVSGQLANYQALRTEAPGGRLAGQASVQALLSNLPDMLEVSYGGFASESGGDVATDVTISFSLSEDISFGVNIGEFRVYGLEDSEVAKLAANETAELGSRIDLRNVSLVGIESIVDAIASEMSETATGLIPEDAVEAELEGADFAINSYGLTYDQIVLDGFVWHAASDEVNAGIDALFASETGEDNAWPLFAPLARFYRSVEIDEYAMYDMDMSIDMDIDDGETEQNMVMDMVIALSAGSDIDRGDFGFSLSEGTSYDLSMSIAAEELSQPIQFASGGSVGLSTMSGMNLGVLMGYLERQEVPDAGIQELMSLGQFESFDSVSTLNGVTISTVGRALVDLSEWNWFVPERIAFEGQDISYNLGGYMDFMTTFMADMPEVAEDPEASEVFAMFGSVREALVDLDMDVINMDMAMSLDWDADTGMTGFDFGTDADGFGTLNMGFAGYMPSYSEFVTAYEDAGKGADDNDKDGMSEDPFDAALEELMASEMALTDFDFEIADDGGMDKVFGLAIAIAQLMPEDNAEAAMIRNASPAELRALVSGLTRMGGMEAAQVFPPAVGYINGIADFVMNGGALRVALNPDEPLGAQSEAQLMQLGDDPQAILDFLGFEFEYTAP
ncbi:MAG: hypothetical protein CBC85_003655 [Hyphomonadaceae bacterium TMED125]|nr:MAG: hypothetical protein CBC85_003655 [Hyphomonadaceae bacterium TMED125]|tara:strand:+ start:35988 stop:37943 length:1956 start_codon:yes stop_codon:yes gene_type:complete